MLYNGVFGCHGNTCYVILWCNFLYSTGKINVCTDLKSIGSELTSCDAKRYVMRHGDYDTSDRYFDKEHLKPTRILYDFRLRSYGSNSGFRGFR